MTPIDRIAQTLAADDDIRLDDWDALPNGDKLGLSGDQKLSKTDYRRRARDVLEAIRHPSEKMVDAGKQYLDEVQPILLEGFWHTMIDAALKEKK